MKRFLPDIVDVHLYGGALLLGTGVGVVHVGYGLALFGLIVLLIGLGLPVWVGRRQ